MLYSHLKILGENVPRGNAMDVHDYSSETIITNDLSFSASRDYSSETITTNDLSFSA